MNINIYKHTQTETQYELLHACLQDAACYMNNPDFGLWRPVFTSNEGISHIMSAKLTNDSIFPENTHIC